MIQELMYKAGYEIYCPCGHKVGTLNSILYSGIVLVGSMIDFEPDMTVGDMDFAKCKICSAQFIEKYAGRSFFTESGKPIEETEQ